MKKSGKKKVEPGPERLLVAVVVTFSAPADWSTLNRRNWLDANADGVAEDVRRSIDWTEADVTAVRVK